MRLCVSALYGILPGPTARAGRAEASPWSRLDAAVFAGSGASSASLWIDDIQFLAGTQ